MVLVGNCKVEEDWPGQSRAEPASALAKQNAGTHTHTHTHTYTFTHSLTLTSIFDDFCFELVISEAPPLWLPFFLQQ